MCSIVEPAVWLQNIYPEPAPQHLFASCILLSFVQDDWERFREARQAELDRQAALRGHMAERRLAQERWIQHKIAKV